MYVSGQYPALVCPSATVVGVSAKLAGLGRVLHVQGGVPVFIWVILQIHSVKQRVQAENKWLYPASQLTQG